MKKIFSLFAALLVFLAVNANNTTFSYTYSAKSTGQGKVYASTEDEFNPTHQTQINNKTGSFTVTSSSTQSSAKKDFFLDAIPNQGYGFVQWRKVDENGNNLKIVGTTRKSKSTESLTTTATDNVFYYEADFAETMVSVGTSDPSKCQVYIDKEINAVGDVVILTASTSDNYSITWTKDGETVSNDNPLTVTVTEKAHYVANPSPVTKQANGYYRIRSANPNYTSNFVRLADNWFDMTAIVGSATSVQTDLPGRVSNASKVLARDLKITTNCLDDPSSIVYVKNSSGNEYEIYAQGTHVKELTTGTHHGSNSGDINYSGANIKILKAGDICSMSAHISMGSSYDFGNFYFYNNNETFSITYTDDSYSTKWYLEPIDTEDNYFIPKFTLEANGRYYATMRLPFPCKIVGTDLKAYSVTAYPASDSEDLATKTEFATGATIPAGLPVVIESVSNTAANNMLMPDGDPSNYISSKVASGGTTTGITTALYNNYGKHKHDDHSDYPVSGDAVGYFSVAYSGSTTLYKLGVQDDKVGFFTEVASGETIYGNEAYSTQPCALFEEQGTPLAEILENGVNGTEYLVSDNLAVVDVADYKDYAFLTDGNGNWIRIECDDSELFSTFVNSAAIKGNTLRGTLSNIELNPVLTVTEAESGDVVPTFSVQLYYLNTSFKPKVNEVIDVVGWWNEAEGTLRAYAPGAIQGTSMTLDTSWGAASNTLENGKKYEIRCAMNIKEAWHTPAGVMPKDYNFDFQNYIGYALRMPDAPTAIGTIGLDDHNDIVNVYNTQGQLLRSNVKASDATRDLPRGVYIVGNKKVIVK